MADCIQKRSVWGVGLSPCSAGTCGQSSFQRSLWPTEPCTAALSVVLANLSLEQLVNVPTHRRGHTLDWLITNRATDVLKT